MQLLITSHTKFASDPKIYLAVIEICKTFLRTIK